MAKRILLSVALLLSPCPVWAFSVTMSQGAMVRWYTPVIPYKIYSGSADVIQIFLSVNCKKAHNATNLLQNAVARAFASWENASGGQVDFKYLGFTDVGRSGSDGQNNLIWITDGWNKYAFGDPHAIAVTISTYKSGSGRMVDADIHFNADNFLWTVQDPTNPSAGESDCMDVQNIATHEIGHLLGADHSSEDIFESNPNYASATMYFASYAGDIAHRTLNDDDDHAILALYPKAPVRAPQLDAINPPQAENNQGHFVLEIRGNNFGDTSLASLHQADYGIDIVGSIEELSEDTIMASFNLTGMPPGDFDLVVSNSYNAQTKLPAALKIDGDPGSYVLPAKSSGGGCGVMYTLNDDSERTAMSLVLMLVAVALLITHRWKLTRIRETQK